MEPWPLIDRRSSGSSRSASNGVGALGGGSCGNASYSCSGDDGATGSAGGTATSGMALKSARSADAVLLFSSSSHSAGGDLIDSSADGAGVCVGGERVVDVVVVGGSSDRRGASGAPPRRHTGTSDRSGPRRDSSRVAHGVGPPCAGSDRDRVVESVRGVSADDMIAHTALDVRARRRKGARARGSTRTADQASISAAGEATDGASSDSSTELRTHRTRPTMLPHARLRASPMRPSASSTAP